MTERLSDTNPFSQLESLQQLLQEAFDRGVAMLALQIENILKSKGTPEEQVREIERIINAEIRILIERKKEATLKETDSRSECEQK